MKHVRRLAQRLKRSGPICSQSLQDFIKFRQSQYPDGICGEENIDGVISSAVFPPTAYTLPLRHGSFSKAEWGARKGFLENFVTPSREVVLAQLVNVCVRGEDGLVYDPVHLVAIEETCRGFDHSSSSHPCFSTPNYPKATRLEGRTLSLLTRGGTCFYHFLLEGLPKASLCPFPLSDFDHILVNGTPDSFQSSWLMASGIDMSKVKWCGGLSAYICDLLCFSPFVMAEQQPTVMHVQNLIRLTGFSPSVKGDQEIVIVSRGDAGGRRDESIIALLNSSIEVAKVYELGRLTPRDQQEVFSSARVIIASHGAGLANLIWCQPGTKVIEFLGFPFVPLFSRISSVMGLEHHCVCIADKALDVTDIVPKLVFG